MYNYLSNVKTIRFEQHWNCKPRDPVGNTADAA